MAEPLKTEDSKGIRAFCNRCGHKTRHDEVHSREYNLHDEVSDRPMIVAWALRKCCGCGEIHALHSVQYVDFPQAEVRYYPSREMRRLPKWSGKLPDHGRTLLEEVYSAIHNGNLCLATMGARALMDLAFVTCVDDCGNFKGKLDAMIKRGFLAPENRDVIEAALDTGNAASHRGHKPDPAELEAVMDVVEHLLEDVFYLRGLGSDLKQAVPARPGAQLHGSESNVI